MVGPDGAGVKKSPKVTFTVQRGVAGSIGVQFARAAHGLPQVTIQGLTPAWKDGTAVLSGLAVDDEILAVDGNKQHSALTHSCATGLTNRRPQAAAAFSNFRARTRVQTLYKNKYTSCQ